MTTPNPATLKTLLEDYLAREVDARSDRRLQIRRGELLLRQGDPAGEMYYVIAGRLRVVKDGQVLSDIEAGSVVGELAFLTGAARAADVVALRDALVLRVNRRDFEHLCDAIPPLRDIIMSDLATRLQATNDLVVSERIPITRVRPRTIALLGAGNRPLPQREINALRDALSGMVRVQVVTAADHAADRGEAALDGAGTIEWFNEIERRADLTLFVCPSDTPAWSRAALRQSDQMILFSLAGQPPAPGEIEAFAFRQIPANMRRLVLVHRERRTRVSGTSAWLDRFPVRLHHHATFDDESDWQRLARFVSGTAVGMVCSGGGAFGPAHVGVWSAFGQAGVTFDAYGGSSAGAAMAAAFALGHDSGMIAEKIDDLFVRNRVFSRFTLPRYGLLDHGLFDAKLIEHFTETDIEDLWLPFFAVASNLASNSLEEIRRGPVWSAVRASTSIPGVLPPFIRDDGAILVDGGVINNVPVDTMRWLKTGPNVISSLLRWTERGAELPYEQFPRRRDYLKGMLWPFGPRRPWAPSLTETLVRSMMVGQTARKPSLTARDLLMTPPLPQNISLLSWKYHREVTASARRYSERAIAERSPGAPDLWKMLLDSP